ncbi:uncharacterized protein LOC128884123 [Hylaeus volcanicus]|uniref:uncharacterized protein LOC128884123 n=1 Tax=Hylaeus volcanicus TaxID=313075 RepID=UPI0023B82254|nr:uncharacterized protein LOC128884123 [Hylaeus volcanicus]
MTHWYSNEEWHHIYHYPFLKRLFTLGDEPYDKLFFCHWFVPPGLRLENYSNKEPLSACQSSESWFHSVEAFTYQLRYAVVPDPGYSISALSEFLYRLLLCCLPTTNGGFTADALLLKNGILVHTWATCIINLIEAIDERLLLLFGTDFPKHLVRNAMCYDLIYSVLQVIGWNVFHIHKLRHTPCYHYFPSPGSHDFRLFAKKLKPLLYNLNTLANDQTFNDLTRLNLFIDNSSTISTFQKNLQFCSTNDE